MHMPEGLIIRPPSEAHSLLVRVVRGCNWNRCMFCGIYDLYNQPHEIRPLDEVLADIDALKAYWGDSPKTAFLGDANPLELPVGFLVPVLDRLRERFPAIKRITSYARSSSLYTKSIEDLKELARHGLTRVHVGLESGSDIILRYHHKGINQKVLIESGRKVHEAGIELSFYVLLGLGGKDRWQEHIQESSKVLNATSPEFIRVRRLWIHPMSRLAAEVFAGRFEEQTPEGTVVELRMLVDLVTVDGPYITCDHSNNYLTVHGRFLKDKEAMVAEIDRFLNMSETTRKRHYDAVGSGI